ncbi:hypothetical protein FQA47_015523 [Oryzias melastigma]|uniref:Uncharacterized protein n=1 Tax=Oryzias melastigma TaxID=30732 RepID=A0A834FRD7_ORYME|nr:hypothetical protein FQA47_015523 [Oryzias melastigma]
MRRREQLHLIFIRTEEQLRPLSVPPPLLPFCSPSRLLSEVSLIRPQKIPTLLQGFVALQDEAEEPFTPFVHAAADELLPASDPPGSAEDAEGFYFGSRCFMSMISVHQSSSF